jgi:hypothetical protein
MNKVLTKSLEARYNRFSKDVAYIFLIDVLLFIILSILLSVSSFISFMLLFLVFTYCLGLSLGLKAIMFIRITRKK